MKLYIDCNHCSKKIYLEGPQVDTRYKLAAQWGEYFTIKCPHCGRSSNYHINEVNAEIDSSAVPGALIGGIIGILAGPIGLISGAVAGGLIGDNVSDAEKKKVVRFNKYYI